MIKAKGIIASPPNWMMLPSHKYGTRRQPSTDRCESERNPIKARSGAKSSGSATMIATRLAATPISTIMTRLSVPTINTAVMPQEIWNSERRNNLLMGKGPLVDSAKGSTFRLIPVQSRAKRSFTSLICGTTPAHRKSDAPKHPQRYERHSFRSGCGGFDRWLLASIKPQQIKDFAILERRSLKPFRSGPE